MVVAEGEGVAGIQPAVVGGAAVFTFTNCNMMELLFCVMCDNFEGFFAIRCSV
jgi:uncharacterized protein affecting Mg2+/Co2+ transport